MTRRRVRLVLLALLAALVSSQEVLVVAGSEQQPTDAVSSNATAVSSSPTDAAPTGTEQAVIAIGAPDKPPASSTEAGPSSLSSDSSIWHWNFNMQYSFMTTTPRRAAAGEADPSVMRSGGATGSGASWR